MIEDEELFKTLLDNLSEGVYFVDPDRHIQYWNKGAQHITGYMSEEVCGKCCADNLLEHVNERGVCLCREGCPLAATMRDCQGRNARVFLKHKDGHRVPVYVTAAAIKDQQGKVIGALETFFDDTPMITALKEIEDLRQISMICPLTGVGNRHFSEQMLGQKLDEMRRRDAHLGLFFFDVDHFKAFNDQYGHAIGDVVLKIVARTLAGAMRSYDFLGRWGGEEFIAIMPNVRHIELHELGERLRALVESSSRTISKNQVRATVSIGVAFSQAGDTVHTLVERADKLMYESKKSGRNRVTVDSMEQPRHSTTAKS